MDLATLQAFLKYNDWADARVVAEATHMSDAQLDQIFDIRSNGATAPECGKVKENVLDRADAQKREQAETMLEAHEALCEAAPENVSRFKDVLDYLKQDLHQTTAGK